MSGFARKASGRAVGDIFPVTGQTVPKNALAVNGRLLPVAAYPKLAAKLGNRFSAGNVAEVMDMFRLPGGKDALPQQANQLRHDFNTYDSVATLASHTTTDTGYSAKITAQVSVGTTKYIHCRYPRNVNKATESSRAITIPFRLFVAPNGLTSGQEFTVNVGLANALASWALTGGKLIPACCYIQFQFVSNVSSITLTSAKLMKITGGTETEGADLTADVVKKWVGDSYYIEMALTMAADYGAFTWRNADNEDTTHPDPAGTFNHLDGLDVCPFWSYERLNGSEQITFQLEWLYAGAMLDPEAPGITMTAPDAVNLCDYPEYQTGLGPDTSADDEAGQQYQNAWWSPLMTYDPTYLTGRRNEMFLWCIQAK